MSDIHFQVGKVYSFRMVDKFFYTGKILSVDSRFIKLTDKKNRSVIFRLDDIITAIEKDENDDGTEID